jgi:hypothetical protein
MLQISVTAHPHMTVVRSAAILSFSVALLKDAASYRTSDAKINGSNVAATSEVHTIVMLITGSQKL